ncbi:ABC transporter permease subunit [Sphaerisporangium sp. TRM90804]|uniref:ABC transporter permease subunit n=1 Tax=Sphaerisporangium sp. TRM90804 TaxID=3031113 RepID=UPI0024475B5F|nr:ABC transporter permease subunit [Sphaerisporangium sp. TRM90804]MDH2429520.1 ABC transporter permease subunit [Sphaerisporangium sp. TRM90804]
MLRSEWCKTRTLRSTWITLFAVVAVGGLFGAMFGGAGAREYGELPPADRASFDPFASVFRAQLFIVLVAGYLGLRAVTVEYATSTMPGTLITVPRRGRVLAAKAVVCAAMGLVAGWAAGLAVYFTGAAVLAAQGVPAYSFGQPGVPRALAGAGLVVAAFCLIGLALGTLVRSTAGALTIVTMVGLLIPAMSPLFPGWLARFVVTYWPTTAGGRLLSLRHDPALLDPWPGFGVLCAYAAALMLLAYAAFRGRDA